MLNKITNKITIPLFIALIVSIAIPVQSADGLIVIKDFRLKFVINFHLEGVNVGQIQSYLMNNLYPEMRDDLIAKLDANFIEYTISKEIMILDQGNDNYEVYPKIFFSGSTNLNAQQLKNGLDSTIDDWLSTVENSLAIQGASNVSYHLHKSWGTIDIKSANL